jgi:hypothetical protein
MLGEVRLLISFLSVVVVRECNERGDRGSRIDGWSEEKESLSNLLKW